MILCVSNHHDVTRRRFHVNRIERRSSRERINHERAESRADSTIEQDSNIWTILMKELDRMPREEGMSTSVITSVRGGTDGMIDAEESASIIPSVA